MPPTKACVLVVDDDHDSREILSEYLTFVGFDVATASNGPEALRRAEDVRPDVVLMDIALPGTMDGLETTRRIGLHPVLKDAVVIAVTALANPGAHQKAMHAGCRSVILKPFDLTALAARIQQLVGQPPRPTRRRIGSVPSV
jgi:two-component system cell cycle response regulator